MNKANLRLQGVFFFAVFASLALAFLLMAAARPAVAQAVPGSADVTRIPQRIESERPSDKTVETPIKVPDSAGRQEPVAGASSVNFTLANIVFDGMTAYSDKDVQGLYAASLGQKITLADVYEIANALTVKYRNDGYILTQVVVPAQTIDGGSVRLRVVEGFVDGVSVQGDLPKNSGLVYAMAEKIRAVKPLNIRQLERYLLLIDDLPGVSVRSVLSPSPDTVGAADIQITVEQDNYEWLLSADNRGSRYIGPLQVNFANRMNSLMGYHERIGIQIFTAPDGHPSRELDYGAVSFLRNIGHEGTTVEARASITATEPGFTLGTFDVKGYSRNLGLVVAHPVIRSRGTNFSLDASFDYSNVERSDNVPNRVEDRIRAVRLGGTYQFADRFVGINTLRVQAHQGLNVLNERKTGSAGLTRANGVSDFTKYTAEISRLQRVTNTLELYLAATGQKSSNTLLSSEEFGVGGAVYGRAYDNSEIVGEEGYAGTVELRYAPGYALTGLRAYQLYGYFDGGRVWDWDATAADNKTLSLAAAGFGLHADVGEKVSTTLEMAFPLTRRVAVENDRSPRVFATVTKNF